MTSISLFGSRLGVSKDLRRYLALDEKLLRFSLDFSPLLTRICIGWAFRCWNFTNWFIVFWSFLSSMECRPVSASISLIGVLFIPPVIILRHWFCTLSAFWKLPFDAFHQVAMPYSTAGLTYPMYAFLRTDMLAPQLVPDNFFMRAARRTPFVWTLSICLFHVSLGSNTTPR